MIDKVYHTAKSRGCSGRDEEECQYPQYLQNTRNNLNVSQPQNRSVNHPVSIVC